MRGRDRIGTLQQLEQFFSDSQARIYHKARGARAPRSLGGVSPISRTFFPDVWRRCLSGSQV